MKTNLERNILLGTVIGAVGWLGGLAAAMGSTPDSDGTWVLVFTGGIIVGCVGLVIFYVGTRCPQCRRSLGWTAIRTQSVGRWYRWLVGLQRCPHCGSPLDR